MEKKELIVIGGSAGSLDALLQIVPKLRADIGIPIVIVVHRGNSTEQLLVNLFALKTRIPIREAEDKEPLLHDTIYIAPGDYHLLVESRELLALDVSEKVNYSRPSIDLTFESAAEVFGKNCIGILLSGANSDGCKGLKAIGEAGGTTIVQEPATASVPYMPKAALNSMKPDHVFSPTQMAQFLNEL